MVSMGNHAYCVDLELLLHSPNLRIKILRIINGRGCMWR